MPTYSYECQGCGHTFDLFQRITEDAKKDCPKCKTPSLKRLIGAGAALIFKGSGFYITDYRSKEYKEQQKKENSAGKNSESKNSESKSSESKNSPQKTSA